MRRWGACLISSLPVLLLMSQNRAYHSPDVVRFLRVSLRKTAGTLLVIWDGQPIKDFLRR